jgi:hypothetical protein
MKLLKEGYIKRVHTIHSVPHHSNSDELVLCLTKIDG